MDKKPVPFKKTVFVCTNAREDGRVACGNPGRGGLELCEALKLAVKEHRSPKGKVPVPPSGSPDPLEVVGLRWRDRAQDHRRQRPDVDAHLERRSTGEKVWVPRLALSGFELRLDLLAVRPFEEAGVLLGEYALDLPVRVALELKDEMSPPLEALPVCRERSGADTTLKTGRSHLGGSASIVAEQ